MTPIDTPNASPGSEVPDEFDDRPAFDPGNDLPGPPRPINWNLLSAGDLEAELLELNRWVDWLRHTYGLPAAVIPPYWHRHPELLWELSALHLHWLCAYDEEQHGSAPLGWHQDFAEARERLHEPALGLGDGTHPRGRRADQRAADHGLHFRDVGLHPRAFLALIQEAGPQLEPR